MDIEAAFYAGRYEDVLKNTTDQSQWKLNPEVLPFVIGALSFRGRLQEALLLFENKNLQKKRTSRIISRFFLGLGRTRQSDYASAREFFAANLREKKTTLSAQETFFVEQGLSFYRYYSGKLSAAEKASQRAFSAAFNGDYLYGKVLSTDMRGHILVQIGDTAPGLELLGRAKKLSLLLGGGSLPKAIQTSILVYKARLGIQAEQTLQELQLAVRKLPSEDTYSRANLLLELARQYTLRGQIALALTSLEEAGPLIYRHENRRQEAQLHLRHAMIAFASGESPKALGMIRAAKRTINLQVDRALLMEVLGMELKVTTQLKMFDVSEKLKPVLVKLTLDKRNSIHRKILGREGLLPWQTESRSLDPLGDLCDLIKSDRESALEEVLKSGFLFFLYDLLPVRRESSILYLDLIPGCLTTLDRGSIQHHEGLTPLLRKLCLALQAGKGQKDLLFQQVWGPKYDPLRHDSVIYASVTSLRKLLGEKAQWLQTLEGGYAWKENLQVLTGSSEVSAPVEITAENRAPAEIEVTNLNYRQLKVLSYLKRTDSIDVQEFKKLFKVSEITASRDLSALMKTGHVVRLGRARATKYKRIDREIL